MHEQAIGEVGMVAVEPQVVQLGRRVCCLTNQAVQRNRFNSHVNRFSAASSPSANRHCRRRKSQQMIADCQTADVQPCVLRRCCGWINRFPSLLRHEGVPGGHEVAASVERVQGPLPEQGEMDFSHSIDPPGVAQHQVSHQDVLDGSRRAIRHGD